MEAVKSAKQNKSVYSEMVDITPEYAEELLRNNKINRPISQRSVKHYAQQMMKGDWCPDTDESIKVSNTKILLDGQHRLNAIILADVTVRMKITYNLPNEIFHYIDQGKKRTSGDVLHIAGIANANQIAGIIKSGEVLKRGNSVGDISAAQAQLSNEDIYRLYEEKAQYWQDMVLKTLRWYRSFSKIVKPTVLGAHFHLFASLNVEAAEVFMEKLTTGVGITDPQDPIRVLRDYFLKQLDLKGKKANTYQYTSALMIKAWNFYRQNKQIQGLRWDPNKESYPQPI